MEWIEGLGPLLKRVMNEIPILVDPTKDVSRLLAGHTFEVDLSDDDLREYEDSALGRFCHLTDLLDAHEKLLCQCKLRVESEPTFENQREAALTQKECQSIADEARNLQKMGLRALRVDLSNERCKVDPTVKTISAS